RLTPCSAGCVERSHDGEPVITHRSEQRSHTGSEARMGGESASPAVVAATWATVIPAVPGTLLGRCLQKGTDARGATVERGRLGQLLGGLLRSDSRLPACSPIARRLAPGLRARRAVLVNHADQRPEHLRDLHLRGCGGLLERSGPLGDLRAGRLPEPARADRRLPERPRIQPGRVADAAAPLALVGRPAPGDVGALSSTSAPWRRWLVRRLGRTLRRLLRLPV